MNLVKSILLRFSRVISTLNTVIKIYSIQKNIWTSYRISKGDSPAMLLTLIHHFLNPFLSTSSAYKHGNSDFIIGTTHPTSEDYLKFIEEAQATLKSGRTR